MRKISQILSNTKSKEQFNPVSSISEANLGGLGFDNAALANIIFSLGSGKIIMVNKAALKLFRYSKKLLLGKNRIDIFDITETDFKKALKQRTVSKPAMVLTGLKKGGRSFPCQTSYAVFSDANGVRNAIMSISDISQSILEQLNKDINREKIVSDNIIVARSKQKNIDIENKKIVAGNIVIARSKQRKIDSKKEKVVAKNIVLAKSKQKHIDIENRKIVAGNIVIALSKQRKIDTKNEKIVAKNIVLAKSKQKNIDIENKKLAARNIVIALSKQRKIDTEKEKIVAKNIVLAKSKQKGIDIRNKKIVDDNIILAEAKSNEEKLDYENIGRMKVLTEIEASFRFMFNSLSDVLFDSDLVSDKILINEAYEKEFGYEAQENPGASQDWSIHIHPDDKAAVMEDYRKILTSTEIEWKAGYRFLRMDGTVANVLSSRIILRDEQGRAYRMIGTMQDISKQKVLEETLEREIQLKEKQIAEAAEDAKNTERSDIGKELHDNINQLLVASRLYLEMAKRGGKDSEMYLSRSSEYTLTAIEEIRKLSKGLTTDIINNLGLCVAIENISRDTMEVNPVEIQCEIKDSIEKSVNDKFKLNVYRIIQEQLNNILKHAHATRIFIKLQQNKRSIKLIISDNGIGFDTSKKRMGIGVANIKSRVASYNGTADFASHPGSGCVLTATFSASDKLLGRA